MKTFTLALLGLLGFSSSTFSQNRLPTKIYLYSLPSHSLITTANPSKPIKIGKCTLLETTLDSLGLDLLPDKPVFIHFEPGRTYYYHRIIGMPTSSGATATLSGCTEQEFWLNAYFSGVGTYRHYFLDKVSGLNLLEEKAR